MSLSCTSLKTFSMRTEKMWMWRLSSCTGTQFRMVNVLHDYSFSIRSEPDLEFEGLLKRQHTRVKYFQGSLMNAMDLERAKVLV